MDLSWSKMMLKNLNRWLFAAHVLSASCLICHFPLNREVYGLIRAEIHKKSLWSCYRFIFISCFCRFTARLHFIPVGGHSTNFSWSVLVKKKTLPCNIKSSAADLITFQDSKCCIQNAWTCWIKCYKCYFLLYRFVCVLAFVAKCVVVLVTCSWRCRSWRVFKARKFTHNVLIGFKNIVVMGKTDKLYSKRSKTIAQVW